MGSQWRNYAKQLGQRGAKVTQRAPLRVHRERARGGNSERTVDVRFPGHLLPAVQRGVRRIPPLMKSDIVEMTGAMTALCQDIVEESGGRT